MPELDAVQIVSQVIDNYGIFNDTNLFMCNFDVLLWSNVFIRLVAQCLGCTAAVLGDRCHTVDHMHLMYAGDAHLVSAYLNAFILTPQKLNFYFFSYLFIIFLFVYLCQNINPNKCDTQYSKPHTHTNKNNYGTN